MLGKITNAKAEKILLKAYNEAAKKMSSGIIEAFNIAWEKAGKSFESEGYMKAYDKMFRAVIQQLLDKETLKKGYRIVVKDSVLLFKKTANGLKPTWFYDIIKK
jgi:hypothetical protein